MIKKLLLVALVIFTSVLIHSRLEASQWKIARTSFTQTSDKNVSIASGATVVSAIMVNSTGSQTCSIWNTDKGMGESYAIHRISFTTQGRGNILPDNYVIYNDSGTCYNCVGSPAARITFYWDWYDLQRSNPAARHRKQNQTQDQ